jgi:energy-converting hydrogenase Eha subunit B
VGKVGDRTAAVLRWIGAFLIGVPLGLLLAALFIWVILELT